MHSQTGNPNPLKFTQIKISLIDGNIRIVKNYPSSIHEIVKILFNYPFCTLQIFIYLSKLSILTTSVGRVI